MEWWKWVTRFSYSVSDIEDYMEYIIKTYKTLAAIPPIHICINRINIRLFFKRKDGFELELQALETIKLLGSTKA